MVFTISVLIAIISSLWTAAPPAADLFDRLFARSRARQQSLHSLRAQFTETTTSTLLAEPIVSRGTVFAARPSRLVMTYASPEPKTIVVDGDRLAVVWPNRQEREQMDIAQVQKRAQKYFLSASAEELRGHFDIEALVDPQVPHSYRVDLNPRRKQIQQGLERLQIWVDQDTMLMVQMRMSFPGGDSKTMSLGSIEVNVPAPDSAFTAPDARTPRP